MSDFDLPLDCGHAVHQGMETYGHVGGVFGAAMPVIEAIPEAETPITAALIPETLALSGQGYEVGHVGGEVIGGFTDGVACGAVNDRRRSRGVGVSGRIPSWRTESCVRACCGCGTDRSGWWGAGG